MKFIFGVVAGIIVLGLVNNPDLTIADNFSILIFCGILFKEVEAMK